MNKCCESCCNSIDDARDEFFDFAENVGASYVEMWNAKYGGAFVDYNGNNVFIKKVVYCAPKVVIIWNDGTKSSASCSEDDPFSFEAGLTIAVMNRVYGYDIMNQLFDDWLPYDYTEDADIDDCYEISIAEVRRKYKVGYKIEDKIEQFELETSMKNYLESCGYKVTKK